MNSRNTLRIGLVGALLILATLVLFWLAGLRPRPSTSAGQPAEVPPPMAAPDGDPRPAVVNNSASSTGVSTGTVVASAAPVAAALPPTNWSLLDDAEPRSHRFNPAKPTRRQPLRSAAVRITPDWLADARAGDNIRFDLGAGLLARGVFEWANRAALPDVVTYAGKLQEPNGAFHLEHHPVRGWAGSFHLKDTDESKFLSVTDYA